MANKNIFSSATKISTPVVDTVNNAGGVAYSMPDKQALAQIVMTGTFNGVGLEKILQH